MVEKFRNILEKMRRERGELSLFALMRMDELTDKWTVVLSAPWATEGNVDIFKYVLGCIKDALLPEELATIARIGIYSKTDHFIQLMFSYNSGASLLNQPLNGNKIHEGYIIESNAGLETSVRQASLSGLK